MTKLVKEMIMADIDWTKEDVVLETKSGVIHKHKEDGEELSSNRVKIYQDSWKTPFYISQKDNYLSIKMYRCPAHYRVSDFKAIPAEKCHLTESTGYWCASTLLQVLAAPYDGHNKYIDVKAREIRIYKDRRVASIIYGDIGARRDQRNWREDEILTQVDKSNAFIIHPLMNQSAKIITAEEEIEANAILPTKQNISSLMFGFNTLYNDCDDLRDHAEIWGRHGEHCKFYKDTQEIIENFFNLTAPENIELYKAYMRGRRNSNISCILDLRDLLLASIKANKAVDSKEQRVKDLITNFQEDWDNLKYVNNQNTAHWYRIGDEIVLIYKGTCYPYRSNDTKFIFTYNVKTKKRFCGEHDGIIWKFAIPSYDHITTMCDLEDRDSFGGQYITTNTQIHCANGVKELFAGTNMVYLLENAGDEQIINRRHNELYTVKDLFTNKAISNFVFSVIFSTGVPVLEQFLKSGLYNLYFQGLEHWGCDWLLANDSYAPSKADPGFISNPNNRGCYNLEYLSRQKNLKKMFGMTMEQLRILNDRYAIKDVEEYDQYSRGNIDITDAERALGVALSDLDKETFNAVLDFSSKHKGHFYQWSTTAMCTAMKNMTPKQRIKFLTDLVDSEVSDHIYNDYLRMREQLQELQQKHPDKEIWDEKEYPTMPKACRKFVAYREGVEDPIVGRETMYWYGGGYRYGTQQNSTIRAYESRFTKAYKRGDIKAIWSDESQTTLLGMLLNLTSGENIRFLHDEASHWVTFYQDEVKQAEFTKAINRVKDLTWKDEKNGLEIVTPKSVSDLKKEGTVLSHCVASYVDAIIADKSNIVFLRRSDMPDMPYYTIEIMDDGSIRQVHCYRNGDLTAEGQKLAYNNSQMPVYNKTFDIIKCLQAWARAKKGKIKASTIHESYGALCARG